MDRLQAQEQMLESDVALLQEREERIQQLEVCTQASQTKVINPTMHQSHIPQHTIQKRNMHIVYCGIRDRCIVGFVIFVYCLSKCQIPNVVLCGAETEIFWTNFLNTMAAHVLAPPVARYIRSHGFTMQGKHPCCLQLLTTCVISVLRDDSKYKYFLTCMT